MSPHAAGHEGQVCGKIDRERSCRKRPGVLSKDEIGPWVKQAVLLARLKEWGWGFFPSSKKPCPKRAVFGHKEASFLFFFSLPLIGSDLKNKSAGASELSVRHSTAIWRVIFTTAVA